MQTSSKRLAICLKRCFENLSTFQQTFVALVSPTARRFATIGMNKTKSILLNLIKDIHFFVFFLKSAVYGDGGLMYRHRRNSVFILQNLKVLVM